MYFAGAVGLISGVVGLRAFDYYRYANVNDVDPTNDRRTYAFVPVILAPSDRAVTDADISYVRSIIDRLSQKMIESYGQKFRFDPLVNSVNTKEPNEELYLPEGDLENVLLRNAEDAIDKMPSAQAERKKRLFLHR